jgi:hypothetical protein
VIKVEGDNADEVQRVAAALARDEAARQRVAEKVSPAAPNAVPHGVVAAWGAVSIASILITISLAPAWLAGGAVGGVLGITALHRHVWRWRPAVWACALVAGVTIVGGVAGHILAYSTPAKPTQAAGTSHTKVHQAINLVASLRAINRSYLGRWGTQIRADPTDRISFALTIQNLAASRSPVLTAWTQVEDDPGVVNGKRVRIVLAQSNGMVLLTGPSVQVRGWSNQFGPFRIASSPASASVSTLSGRLLSNVAVNPTPSDTVPVELQQSSDSIRIGRLNGHKSVRVQFEGGWRLPGLMGFGLVLPVFHIDGAKTSEWRNIGSVHVGDLLTIGITLDSQSNFASVGQVRVSLHPESGGRFVRLKVFGALGQHEQLIGAGIINSANDKSIVIEPRQGTTLLRTGFRSTACSKLTKPVELQEGITQGGVTIGMFGGFTPHSTCAGIDRNRYITFQASVMQTAG